MIITNDQLRCSVPKSSMAEIEESLSQMLSVAGADKQWHEVTNRKPKKESDDNGKSN